MKEVYFDTDVYAHIYRRVAPLTDKRVRQLETAVRSDKIRILSSAAVIEETVLAVLDSEKEALARLQLIRRLAKRKRIIKSPDQILRGDIVAYSQNVKLPSHYISPPQDLIQVVVNGRAGYLETLHRKASDTQKRTDNFYVEINKAFRSSVESAGTSKESTKQSFEDYWRERSIPFVEQLATSANVLDACKKRGLEGLLEVRSIRLVTVAQLALGYAATGDLPVTEPEQSRYIQQAVIASAVDAFVTHDQWLADALRRVEVKDFQVIDLHTLLEVVS